MDFLGPEEDTLLEAMLVDAMRDIANSKPQLSSEMLKNMLTGTPEENTDLKEFENLTLKELLYHAVREMPHEEASEGVASSVPMPAEEAGMVFGEGNDAKIQFNFDDLDVRIILRPPMGGKPLTEEAIKETLDCCGITNGIKYSFIHRLAQNPIYFTSFVIACGTPPSNGDDGQAIYYFDTEQTDFPKVQEDTGMVNYEDLYQTKSVMAGDLLCEIIKPTIGINGKDVFGNPIPCQRGKEIKIEAEQNTGIFEDEKKAKIYASCDGDVRYMDGKIHVDKTLSLQNVNAITGNIEFDGTIHIRGNVSAGYSVKAKGNIVVYGMVESAELMADGHIVVYGGIHGDSKKEVTAEGSVSALFIENSRVIAGENIFAGYVLNSYIACDKRVILSGEKGTLIGGECWASEIRANEIGNDSFLVTEVWASYSLRLQKKIEEINVHLEKCKMLIEKITGTLKMGESEELRTILIRTKSTEKQLKTKVQLLEKKIEKMMKEFEPGIYVGRKLYPNAILKVEEKSYRNMDVREHCAITRKNGHLVVKS